MGEHLRAPLTFVQDNLGSAGGAKREHNSRIAAAAEFAGALKIVVDDFHEEIADAVAGVDLCDYDADPDDESVVIVDKIAFKALQRDLDDYSDVVRRAIQDFNWAADRLLRRLKKEIAR